MLELRLQHRLRLGLVGRRRRIRSPRALALGGLIALAALSGCGQGGSGAGPQGSSDATSPPSASSAGTTSATGQSVARTTGQSLARSRAGRGRGRGGLAYSSASAEVVQTQPAPGTCHAIGSGVHSRPDPHCTPGALNPAVTQATLARTICRSGWTKTVRPPERVTEREKSGSMAAYGDSGSMSAFEYDHFVPLELGGAVNDARNLWPEPGGSPNPKDAIENELRRQVCDGQVTLAHAQRAIAANWVALARRTTPASPSATPASPSAAAASPSPAAGTPSPARTTSTASTDSGPGSHCTINASYSTRYHDYDVYVHSNRPDQTVVVTDAAGHSARWHTDASGYADVYFRAPADEAGQAVTAHIGGGSCQGTL